MYATEAMATDYLTELSALYEISSIPTSLISHEELGRLVLDKATRLLGAPMALLYRWQGDDRPLRLWMARGVPTGEVDDLSPEREGIVRALDEGQPVILEGLDSVRALGVLPANYLARQGLCLPIRAGAPVRALLCAFRLTDSPFTRTDLALFSVLADRTRTALENMRLFAETQRRYRELESEITERKRSQEALRVSEERFALAVKGSNDGIYDWDIQDKSLYWSPRLKELLGYSDDELDVDFDTFDSLLHPHDREHTRAAIEAHLKDGGLYDVEQRLRTKSGEYRCFRARGQALWDEAGNPIRMVGSTTDITERKRAEEKLSGPEKKYRTLYETITDGIAGGPMDGRILECNQAFADMLGYSKEQLRNLTYQQLTPKRWHRMEAEIVEEQVLKRGYSDEYEKEYVRKDGTLFPISAKVWLLRDEDGKAEGMWGIVRDITERKRAEENLKEYSEHLQEMVEERTKELEDAHERLVRQEKLAVLGQLAGGVGHELRNPLGAIKNAAYFLNMVLEEPEPEVKETLEILEKEVETSESIISSLLDFARPKPLTPQEVHINEIVREALSRMTMPDNIKVVRQLDEPLPTILADPDQLGQVFGNIILNAVQAMPKGGQLLINSQLADGGWVTVSFTDTGVGIPEENLGKVFEPLFTTKARGIGLGLPIAKTLVEGHGGTIKVKSVVGKGSTFTVTLAVGRGRALSDAEGEKLQHGRESQRPDSG